MAYSKPQPLLLLLLLLTTLTSCITNEQYDNTPQGNFDALWTTIDEHYCFLDLKQSQLGVDWDEVRARHSPRIAHDMTSSQLFEVLASMLSELQDGHVNLSSAADLGRNWSYWEDYPTNFSSELQQQYLGHDYRIASGIKYRILDDNVGYLVYNSFSSAIGSGNISEALNYMRLCKGLIIDIRNNGGGQLSNAETLASHFTEEKTLVGYISHKRGPGRNDFSTPMPEYISPSPGIRWQKPVIILTNRRCYSAANTFVRNMLCFPNIRTLGDQTGGGGGMPFTSELPNGWTIRFSACPQYDTKMQHIEFGIPPTIPCQQSSQDAAQGYDTLIETARRAF